MCGFAGIVGDVSPQRAEAAIQAMTDAQIHRGPDDDGTHVLTTPAGTVALGARRLAIIDVSPLGHQPMVNPDTGDVLAYNGEIYNCVELRAELESLGFTFKGHSDTEVLLRAYEAWERDSLDRLRGMFAFGLWDARRERLLLARDHLGIKPLYYSAQPDRFVCASEIGALLAGGLVDGRLHRGALGSYLAYGAVQEPLTILDGVVALPAGSWMEVDRDGRIAGDGRYWSFPDTDQNAELTTALVDEGRALLERSVARHLLSDVPLGVFLSGGLDSTSVAGLAQRASSEQVHAFNVSFPERADLDEQPVAARSAERLGLAFHPITVDGTTALSWAEGGLAAMDQPSVDGLNTYMVSRAVREAGLTVALSGQGGDEIFGGYRSFTAIPKLVPLARAARIVPAPLRMLLASAAALKWGKGAARRARGLADAPAEVTDLYLIFRRLLSNEELADLGLTHPSLGLSHRFLDPTAGMNGTRDIDRFALVSRLETRYYLGNTLLRDGDVFGMANSLEIRVPMLDRDVVDWAMRLPGAVLAPPRTPPKYLLRRICADLLAQEQLDAEKQGFGLPLDSWMKGPLRELKDASLQTVADSGLIDASGMRRIEARYLDDTYRSAWTRVWALVTLGRWLDANRAAVSIR